MDTLKIGWSAAKKKYLDRLFLYYTLRRSFHFKDRPTTSIY